MQPIGLQYYRVSRMRIKRKPAIGLATAALVGMLGIAVLATTSMAADNSLKVVAVVNDEPITEYDVSQRVKLEQMLGGARGSAASLRKKALEELVDDVLKRTEAKRLKIDITTDQVAQTIDRIAKNSSGSTERLKSRLEKSGIQMKTLARQIEAQLAWSGVIRQRFGRRVQVDEQDVDRKFEQLKNDPPGKTRRFFVIQQVVLPYDKGASRELVYSRMVEAQGIQKKFKGCSSLKRVTSSVYNVRVRDIGEVPQEAVPDKLRQLLVKIGPGNLTPPNVTTSGIELIAYCSNKVIKPEPLTREQVQERLLERQYGLHSQRYLRDLRRDSLVEYR